LSVPYPASFHLHEETLVHRLLNPAFAFLDTDDRPVWKLARCVASVPNDLVQCVPGIHPSHFDIGIRRHDDVLAAERPSSAAAAALRAVMSRGTRIAAAVC
jgi:hypothetical protein